VASSWNQAGSPSKGVAGTKFFQGFTEFGHGKERDMAIPPQTHENEDRLENSGYVTPGTKDKLKSMVKRED
jgi:hypothetical protein